MAWEFTPGEQLDYPAGAHIKIIDDFLSADTLAEAQKDAERITKQRAYLTSLVPTSSVYSSGSAEVPRGERSLEELESELAPSAAQQAREREPARPPGLEQEDEEVGP